MICNNIDPFAQIKEEAAQDFLKESFFKGDPKLKEEVVTQKEKVVDQKDHLEGFTVEQ